MGHRAAVLVAGLWLVPGLGCSDSPSGPCSGVDCGGHGLCIAVGDLAYCWCAAGFHPVGMNCVSNDSTDPCRDVLCWGHGVCGLTPDGLPTCDCEPGYDVYYDLYCLPHVEPDASADGDERDAADGEAEAEAEPEDAPAFTYAWQAGSWSDCSASCGGGSQSRSVACVRSDGIEVDVSLCDAPLRPADSQSCNTDPCCATEALAHEWHCEGTERAQWFPYGENSGSAADQAACAEDCTRWAVGEGMSEWCCQLYEDSSDGTTWVCRVYDTRSSAPTASPDYYAGLGGCG